MVTSLVSLGLTILLGRVVRDPRLQRHRYVYLTAVHPTELARDCEDLLERLEVPVLSKPFDIDRLLHMVQKAQERLHADAADPDALPVD